ncbi:MAG: hypothetical protein HQM09_24540 [Candidatus Riflebacteria bacterium]|nr:hypothetical protein [Candidatus Riflebacteria bacterium]
MTTYNNFVKKAQYEIRLDFSHNQTKGDGDGATYQQIFLALIRFSSLTAGSSWVMFTSWERGGNSCVRESGIVSGAGVGMGFSGDRPFPLPLSHVFYAPITP